ncbi:Deleted in malignant brain tumors 1 protein [Holothuria leucospilota]|uniref:Deleted in malignant brain tumors 1 protein n=1 Tax=Holothuria leucospilota TaxID=206669 RepID=A0A9Q1HHZ8_HOLLE|nr:Deleted in malignant brain tumors 1 protein [Holothuria leucospilota]
MCLIGPIVCSGAPCPVFGTFSHVVDPTGPPSSCQEVIIESPGYPNGYLDTSCGWEFNMIGDIFTSIVITFIDFDGGANDNLLIQGARRSNPTFVIFNGDATAVPSTGHIRRYVTTMNVQFMPSATRFDKRGFRIRIMFSVRASTDACSAIQTLALSAIHPSAALNSPGYPNRYPTNSECYYAVTSPAGTHINIEFIGRFNVEEFEDFTFIYDSFVPAQPQLLRIVSDTNLMAFSLIKTKTNSVQIAFKDNLSTTERGFFLRVSFEEENNTVMDVAFLESQKKTPPKKIKNDGHIHLQEATNAQVRLHRDVLAKQEQAVQELEREQKLSKGRSPHPRCRETSL